MYESATSGVTCPLTRHGGGLHWPEQRAPSPSPQPLPHTHHTAHAPPPHCLPTGGSGKSSVLRNTSEDMKRALGALKTQESKVGCGCTP